jgi:hypothetical protein
MSRVATRSPDVSIIIRTMQGRETYLERALASVNGQKTTLDIEAVVVCDGGEVDRTAELNQAYQKITVVYVPTKVPVGRSEAANLGLATVRGEFVNFLDDDDLFYESHVDICASVLGRRAHIAAIYTAADEVPVDVHSLSPLSVTEYPGRHFFRRMHSSLELFDRNPFPIQAVMFRRSLLGPHAVFSDKLDALEDWLFWQVLLVGTVVEPHGLTTSRFFIPHDSSIMERRLLDHEAAYPTFRQLQNEMAVPLTRLAALHQTLAMEKRPAAAPKRKKWSTKRVAGLPIYAARQTVKFLRRKLSPPSMPADYALPSAAQVKALQRTVFEGPTALDRTDGSKRIAVFTSVNKKYFDKATVLARSVRKHYPAADFHIILGDAIDEDVERCFEAERSIDCVYPYALLPIPNVKSWSFMRNVVELCTGLKPPYMRRLLESYDIVIYLDPDTRVYSSLEPIVQETEQHSLCLTPHCDQPGKSDEQVAFNELSSLAHGVFNLGFVSMKNDATGRAAAEFWDSRVFKYGFADINRGMFTDQNWFNFAPIFFPGMKIIHHPGVNTASWNIASRRLSKKGRQIVANGEPLIFFHFSGFDGGTHRRMAKLLDPDNKVLAKLIKSYDDEVASVNREQAIQTDWCLGKFDNGEAITTAQRNCYRQHTDLQAAFRDPYRAEGSQTYLGWIRHRGVADIEKEYDNSVWVKRHF